MSKQLILITADFNCGHCTKARKELPTVWESNGWEYTEIKNEKTEIDASKKSESSHMSSGGVPREDFDMQNPILRSEMMMNVLQR